MMAVANDLLFYQISVYSVVYPHSPTPPKPTVNESPFCSSPPLSAPATRLHLPVSHRLPRSGAEAKNPSPFSPSSRLMSIVGRATQTPRTHGFISVFGVWGEIKGGEVPVVHQRISWTRFGTTFSDRGRQRESSCKGQMHPEPCWCPLLPPFIGFPKIRGFSQAFQRRPQVAVFQRRVTIVARWSWSVDSLSSERWGGPH